MKSIINAIIFLAILVLIGLVIYMIISHKLQSQSHVIVKLVDNTLKDDNLLSGSKTLPEPSLESKSKQVQFEQPSDTALDQYNTLAQVYAPPYIYPGYVYPPWNNRQLGGGYYYEGRRRRGGRW